MDIKTLSAYISCSESKIRVLMKGQDPLPSYKEGRSRRFNRQAVDAWVTKRTLSAQAVDQVLREVFGNRLDTGSTIRVMTLSGPYPKSE